MQQKNTLSFTKIQPFEIIEKGALKKSDRVTTLKPRA